MSDRSWNYMYRHFLDAAERLAQESDSNRRLFGEHVKKVAEAVKVIERVDNGDVGPDREAQALRVVLGALYDDRVIKSGV